MRIATQKAIVTLIDDGDDDKHDKRRNKKDHRSVPEKPKGRGHNDPGDGGPPSNGSSSSPPSSSSSSAGSSDDNTTSIGTGTGTRSSKSKGKKKSEKMELKPQPTVATLRDWRVHLRKVVVSRSGVGLKAMHWIRETELPWITLRQLSQGR